MCFADAATMMKGKGKPPTLNFVGKSADEFSGFVVGWRAWKARKVNGELRLSSPIRSTVWEPGKPVVADAALKPDEVGGVYAFRSIKLLRDYQHASTTKDDDVIGQVILWGGQIAEHKDGFRGEKAYPLKLWTNDPKIQSQLRDTYKASVEIGYARMLDKT